MILDPHRLSLSLVLAAGLTVSISGAAAEDQPAEEKKSGFLSRLFKSDKEKQPEPPPAPTPPPAPKKPAPAKAPAPATAATPGKAPKIILKDRDSGKPSTSPSSSKPKSSEPAAKKPTSSKSLDTAFGKPGTPPASSPAKPKDTAPTSPTAAAPPSAASKPAPPAGTVTPPLPGGDGWEVVKLNGRDYVTADSIQRFFRFATLKRSDKHVWFNSSTVIMKAEIGSQDLLINSIKFILSNPVTEDGGKALISRVDLCKLIDPILRPSYITTSTPFDTVVIDAGHGGHDSGARGVYGYEKDFTLEMAKAVRDALVTRGVKVKLTRDTDVFIPLKGRVAIANETPNSILVSLHFNSSGSSAASGIETFALSPQGSSSTFMGERGWDNSSFSGNRQDSENIALATAIHAMVINKFRLIDRGIKRARFTVLTGCLRPGILFEGGFVTNSTECRLIASQNYRQLLANIIADGILNYRKALAPRLGNATR